MDELLDRCIGYLFILVGLWPAEQEDTEDAKTGWELGPWFAELTDCNFRQILEQWVRTLAF